MAKQERAFVTRQQIIRAAAESFDVTGYERTTLSDIVDGSGVTKGALYFHFKSKDELGAVVIEEQHAISMAAAAEIHATGAPALEQLVMLAYEMGRQVIEDPVVRAGIRLTLELSAAEGPPKPYVDWISGLDQLFRDAAAEGDLADTMDAAHLARYFVSAFTGVQLVSNVLTQRQDLESRIEQMLEIFLPSIMAPRRRRRIDSYRHARWVPTQG
ncbi:ScbR family autoregulator-binding transcription factor [Rhodococcus tukisamuensis]|uniref:DNA-binding transcriptional regulator, AcrR family n=1 Tax=Rhodococcus tukisamuensis TaxID=168276 RepID=A0A1G6T7A2_9NOCA|nr:ScbR family autoregulator-binding transcription factor [Rhodococcus tukisamuensis]SDD24909.1 DNA-binding transcriptional regulator, AcrR family [Rhodococcus tukisamuensis]